jgi:hypothetical protein
LVADTSLEERGKAAEVEVGDLLHLVALLSLKAPRSVGVLVLLWPLWCMGAGKKDSNESHLPELQIIWVMRLTASCRAKNDSSPSQAVTPFSVRHCTKLETASPGT